MSSIEEKTQRLIRDYFTETAAPADPTQRRNYVERWLKANVEPFRTLGLSLISTLQPTLRDVERLAIARDGPRHVYRIDSSNLVKTPASILEKMAREWTDEALPPPICFSNFPETLRDLARFRIVANFLSDARTIADTLERPYQSVPTDSLTPLLRTLAERFDLVGGAFKDSVLMRPRDRRSGERCWKGAFRPKPPFHGMVVEVQILSQLAEAWDKKEHFLSYEVRRRGDEVPVEQECELHAMSELLFLADQTFDRIRKLLRASSDRTEAP